MTINDKSIKMKFSLSLISICILSFILVYSCSTEEEEDSVTPVSVAPVEYTLTVSAAEGGTVSTEEEHMKKELILPSQLQQMRDTAL